MLKLLQRDLGKAECGLHIFYSNLLTVCLRVDAVKDINLSDVGGIVPYC